jgi:hypothetical protein
MKILFNIRYTSNWGQVVCVSGSSDFLSNWDVDQSIQLNYIGNDEWAIELEAEENGFLNTNIFFVKPVVFMYGRVAATDLFILQTSKILRFVIAGIISLILQG